MVEVPDAVSLVGGSSLPLAADSPEGVDAGGGVAPDSGTPLGGWLESSAGGAPLSDEGPCTDVVESVEAGDPLGVGDEPGGTMFDWSEDAPADGGALADSPDVSDAGDADAPAPLEPPWSEEAPAGEAELGPWETALEGGTALVDVADAELTGAPLDGSEPPLLAPADE